MMTYLCLNISCGIKTSSLFWWITIIRVIYMTAPWYDMIVDDTDQTSTHKSKTSISSQRSCCNGVQSRCISTEHASCFREVPHMNTWGLCVLCGLKERARWKYWQHQRRKSIDYSMQVGQKEKKYSGRGELKGKGCGEIDLIIIRT